jgi:hypothetical protein
VLEEAGAPMGEALGGGGRGAHRVAGRCKAEQEDALVSGGGVG